MTTLTFKNNYQTNATLLPNDFIDRYMASANGEFVKVYLFLLRHMDDSHAAISVSVIADCLNHTENDILRAFRYWESAGLLALEYDTDGCVSGIELNRNGGCTSGVTFTSDNGCITGAGDSAKPAACSTAPSPIIPDNAVQIDTFRAQKELKSLFFIAEQYLGKTLTRTDVDAITYFYESLRLPANLIEYLIESCVENGHKSMHYIQKVALSWAEEGIRTVSQAKEQSALYNKNCYAVLNAFGIKNRGPASSEIAYIRKWADEYGFSVDIMQEACRRTISATHQPSFEYADSILTRWSERNVRHMKDITALDEAYLKEKAAGRTNTRTKAAARNMNNFERRRYDMDSLEEQLLNSNG